MRYCRLLHLIMGPASSKGSGSFFSGKRNLTEFNQLISVKLFSEMPTMIEKRALKNKGITKQ